MPKSSPAGFARASSSTAKRSVKSNAEPIATKPTGAVPSPDLATRSPAFSSSASLRVLTAPTAPAASSQATVLATISTALSSKPVLPISPPASPPPTACCSPTPISPARSAASLPTTSPCPLKSPPAVHTCFANSSSSIASKLSLLWVESPSMLTFRCSSKRAKYKPDHRSSSATAKPLSPIQTVQPYSAPITPASKIPPPNALPPLCFGTFSLRHADLWRHLAISKVKKNS